MSEQATEEQLAQCFLAANCLHIIRGAKRDQQEGDTRRTTMNSALRVGPPLIAVKRVKGSERSIHHRAPLVSTIEIDPPAYGVNGAIESKYSSITDLADMFSIKEEQGALSMATNLKGHLQPDFAFYKMYEHDTPEGPAWYPVRMRPEEFPYQDEPKDQDHDGPSKIIFTKIEWQQLGGNPAEIDSNIAFKVTLNTKDLSNFFTPWVPAQRQGIRPSMGRTNLEIPDDVRAVFDETTGIGLRWIDLIQVSSGRGCIDKYKPSRIQLKVGYKWDKEAKDEVRIALAGALNPPPESGITPLVSKGGLTGDDLVEWHLNDFEAMVLSQEKRYDLNLMRHELKYVGSGKGIGTVELEISYIASIEQSQRNTQADLFHDYGLRKYAEIKKAELAKLNQQLGAIQPIVSTALFTVPGAPVGGLTPEQKAKNERRASCRAELEITVQELQQQIANANVRAKKRLLNQLLLGATYGQQADVSSAQAAGKRNVSRVYWTLITQEALMSTLPFTTQASPEQTMIPIYNYASMMQSGLLEAGANGVRSGAGMRYYERTDERAERALLELYGQDISDLPDLQIGGSVMPTGIPTTGETGLATSIGKNPKKLIKFVFFGDIIEAALELVAQNLYIEQNQGLQDRIERRAGIAADENNPPETGRYTWSHIDYTHRPTFFAGIGADQGPEPQSSSQTLTPQNPTQRDQALGIVNTGFRTEAETGAADGFTDREKLVKRMLGEFITGDITMPKPNIGGVLAGPRGVRTINIADLPISWDFFRQWWMNVAISRPGQTTLYFREFLIKLITDLLPRAIGRGCAWIADGEKTPQIMLNNYSVSGDNIMGRAQVYPAFRKAVATGTPSPLIGRYTTGDEIQDVLNSDETAAQRALEAGPITPITAISMKDTGAFVGTGDVLEDLEYNRAHINPVGENSAVVESVQFVKEDLPYIREANIDAGPLGIIREKYNCNLTVIGNTMYKPGGIFYINPNTLARGKNTKAYGGGPEDPLPSDKFVAPTLPSGLRDDTPYARLLGLGGYYVITRITHVMDLPAVEWTTTFQAKWLAFANENDPCVPDQDENWAGKNQTDADLECPEAFTEAGGAIL